jgi:hypothetical protein
MLKYQTIQNCKYDEIWKVLNYKLQSFLTEAIIPQGETVTLDRAVQHQ